MSHDMQNIDKLFTPIKIGTMQLDNRIVMAPMTLDYANPDETPSERQIAYYTERAKGGAGLIVTEVVTVDEEHRYQQASIGLYKDEMIPHHKALVDAVHAHGAKIVPQLSHTGPESLGGFYKGIQPFGPSVVRTPTTMQVCRELEVEEIPALVALYGDAARRAREAGYDGVELHAAHSYMLLGSFLSPLRNFRSDEYGGKLPGRMKFLLEVVADIRSKAGEDFPLQIRLSGNERDSGGRDINETVRIAQVLEQAGVDAFHISGGVSDKNITQIIASPEYPEGFNAGIAATLKQVIDVPVMVVGRNLDIDTAARLVDDEMADMAVIGRALLADPQLPNKARAGQLASIRPCNSCQDCVDSIMRGGGSACALNPHSGRELELPLPGKTETPKRVLVVGGGIAGLEAARMAAEAGHQVTLREKDAELGGHFRLSASLLADHQPYLDWLRGEVARLPITVETGTTVDSQSARDYNADALILACGSGLAAPAIDAEDQPSVLKGAALEQAILNDFEGIDGDVIVYGGSELAADIADALASKRQTRYLAPAEQSVYLVNNAHRFGEGAGKKRRGDISRRLDLHGVRVLTGFNVAAIDGKGARLTDEYGKEHTIAADHVLLVSQAAADEARRQAFEGAAPEVLAIGDCANPGVVRNAVLDAAKAVANL